MIALGKYMQVGDDPAESPSGKTKVWSIFDRNGGLLGTVSWFGRWRCYAFNPCECTTYNGGCMDELASFCKRVTQEHRK